MNETPLLTSLTKDELMHEVQILRQRIDEMSLEISSLEYDSVDAARFRRIQEALR